jgi:hypothetical protein
MATPLFQLQAQSGSITPEPPSLDTRQTNMSACQYRIYAFAGRSSDGRARGIRRTRMKIFNTDGSILMEIKAVERNGNFIDFRGTVMGAMPVKGRLTPEEARSVFKLIRPWRLGLFLLTFMFRKS